MLWALWATKFEGISTQSCNEKSTWATTGGRSTHTPCCEGPCICAAAYPSAYTPLLLLYPRCLIHLHTSTCATWEQLSPHGKLLALINKPHKTSHIISYTRSNKQHDPCPCHNSSQYPHTTWCTPSELAHSIVSPAPPKDPQRTIVPRHRYNIIPHTVRGTSFSSSSRGTPTLPLITLPAPAAASRFSSTQHTTHQSVYI